MLAKAAAGAAIVAVPAGAATLASPPAQPVGDQIQSPTTGVDPHPALYAEAEALGDWICSPDRGDWSDEEADPHHHRLHEILDRIAETPARTLAGVRVQVALAVDCTDQGSQLGEAEVTALRNVLVTLDRLAGSAAHG